jgi:hypothetical protein
MRQRSHPPARRDARLIADTDRAETHVHLLFYVFADDGASRLCPRRFGVRPCRNRIVVAADRLWIVGQTLNGHVFRQEQFSVSENDVTAC